MRMRFCCAVLKLLIVPYGIEIHFVDLRQCIECLLIVPYGIEIVCVYVRPGACTPLLIVPYGIEISSNQRKMRGSHTFNRTLWN